MKTQNRFAPAHLPRLTRGVRPPVTRLMKFIQPFAVLAFALVFTTGLQRAEGQSTSFTYQGRLQDGTNFPGGLYDMTFKVFNALSGPSQVGATASVGSVPVSNGLFTVTLDFGVGIFTGPNRWLEIAVASNTLSPRQFLASTPYAIRALDAATAANVGPNGVPPGAIQTGAVGTAQIADGSIGTGDLSATVLSNTFWRLSGNAGTTPGLDFLGTTDNQALEVKVNNTRALRVEPGTTANLIGGHSGNTVAAGVVGAAIGGGGAAGAPNRVNDTYGAIAGGLNNTVNKNDAFIGGGIGNTVSGDRAVIAGGRDNNIQTNASNAAIGGGRNNIVASAGLGAAIGGGDNNTASGLDATVPGGSANTAGGDYSFAAGRRAKANNPGAFVWADSSAADFASTLNNQFLIRAGGGVGIGTNNPQEALHVNGRYLRVEGLAGEQVYLGGDGVANDVQLGSLSGSVSNVTLWNPTSAQRMNLEVNRLDAYSANVSGLLTATLSNATFTASPGNSPFSVGTNATKVVNLNADLLDGLDSSSFWKLSGNGSTVPGVNFLGTTDNQALELKVNNVRALRLSPWSGSPQVIGGSLSNRMALPDIFGGTISGGGSTTSGNVVSDDYSTIGGGEGNTAGNTNGTYSDASHAVVGGGSGNRASGKYSTVVGGRLNAAAGDSSVAMGNSATAGHNGTFVFSDLQGVPFSSTSSNQFLIRAGGGVGINETAPEQALDVNGNDPASTNRFLAPSVLVTVNSASQSILVTSHKAFGSTSASGAQSLNLYIGHRVSGSAAAPTTDGGGALGNRVAVNTRVTMGLSYVITGLAAGTYEVGLVGNSSDAANWNSNDWGYTTAVLY